MVRQRRLLSCYERRCDRVPEVFRGVVALIHQRRVGLEHGLLRLSRPVHIWLLQPLEFFQGGPYRLSVFTRQGIRDELLDMGSGTVELQSGIKVRIIRPCCRL